MVQPAKFIRLFSVAAMATWVSGCASIISGTTETILVQAVDKTSNRPIPDAKCVVINSNKDKVYPVSGNPGTVVVSKKENEMLKVQCKAPGYVKSILSIPSAFDPWALGNIIFPPAFVVDVVTGAVQKYTAHVTVVMAKQG